MIKFITNVLESSVENEIIKDFPGISTLTPVAYECDGASESIFNGKHSGHAYEVFAKSINFKDCNVYDSDYENLFNEIVVDSKKLYKDSLDSAYIVTSGKANGNDFVSVTLVYNGFEEYYDALGMSEESEDYEVQNETIPDFNTFINVLGDYNLEALCVVNSTLYM